MLILILIFGFLLVIASAFSRPEPVIVVREHRNGNPLWLILLIGVGIWFYTSSDSSASSAAAAIEPEHARMKEHAGDSLRRNPMDQIPVSTSQMATSNIHVNMAPPSHKDAILTTYHDIKKHQAHLKHIILVKRFTDRSKAVLLQRHFSQWGMQVLLMDDPDYPYWNGVIIDNEAEGRAKIREWMRHSTDFEHMGLEFRLMDITTQQ